MGRKKASGSTAAEEVGGEPAMAASKKNKKKGQFAVDDDEYMVVDQLDEDSSMRSNGQHHVSADNETDLASSFEQMDLSQKKKKTRGKNTEPDPDDTESELSVAADNGAASKKKGKKGKKGFPVDDDEYDVSALDDAKSVQSTESSQSHDHMKKGGHDLDEKDNDSWSQDAVQGMRKGKKGKPSKKERDADDYTEEDLGLTSIKKGKKAMGAAKPKSNASFALLEEMDGFGNVPEDGSEVNDSVPMQLEDGEDEVGISEHVLFAGKTKSKAGIKNVKASGIEDVETNSIKEDEDLDTIIFSGTKKAKGKKGAKSDHMGFAALDTLTDSAKSAEEDNENEESLAFSGKKKSKKSKDIKKTVSEETVDELPYKEGKDGQSETMKVETVVDEVSEADALFFSGKKKSKGKKGMKTMEEASEAGLAVLDDHADGFKGVLDQEYDLGDEDAIIFSGKKKSKKNKEIKRAEDDEFGLETATKADNVDDALDSEDAIVFSGKKKGKIKQGSKVALDDDLDDTSLSRERGLSVTEHLDDSSLQISDELRSSALAEEDTVQFTGKKKGKKGKISDKPSEDADIDAILADLERTKADKDSKALPGEVDVVDPIKFEDVGAASKKKSKKGKKSGRTVQEEEDLDAILAELEGPKPVQQPESSNSVQPAQEASSQPHQEPSQPAYVTASMPPEVLDEADGVDAVESAAAKKKKKKKEKEKAKTAGKQLDQADAEIVEDQQEAPKSKVLDKKVPKHVREMQERLARQKEAEERIRREEEERRRKEEEEQRRLEELEREREEAKRRRKEREKEKLLKKKQEGKLLTGKQKEEARRLALMREQLLAQKGSADLDAPTKEDSIPKKPKYDNKKKRRPQGGESVSSTEQPVEDLEVPLPQESHMEIDFVVEKETETESEVVVVEEEVVAEAEAEEEDEDWDAKSWDIELPPVKSAFAEEEDTVSAPKVAKSVITQPSQDAPPAKRPVSPQKSSVQKPRSTAPQPSSNDLESEDETDSEDETESEEEDADTRRRREASLKREARKAEALAKRSAEDLRSPICCILGHVDTGKTKLLDCIRRTNVQEGEAGGITQQIGATYFPMENILERTKELKSDVAVRVPGLLVIDTPGHESFTNLRSRGSGLCDIAILVVDIMHGLEPQTLESLNLLKMRHTPFVVALNKVDRLYNWKTLPNAPIRIAFKQQSKDVINEFERRLSQIVTELKEQGMNSELYYKNKEIRKVVSIVPTSAISGEGVPDLLMLLVHLTQKVMEDKLMYISEVQCTVLEVKVIEGLGTTIDVILVNGVLHESDQIVVCGMQGPIVTNIRALLTPHPMKELRVKGSYQHHKELKAAQGIKITAQGLEHAIAGTQLHVVGPDDDLEDVKVEAMQDMKNVMSRVDKSGEGVCVQASTLGSLEALLEFLKSPAVKIPVSGINIGPVHKRDVMRASVMLERKKKEYATILAFDVKVTPEAKELAEELGVKIFMADIIYHLFDQFTAYMNNIKEEKRKEVADEAVFPCVLSIKPQFVFNKKDPIILGVDVLEGIARIGTPLCVPSQDMIDIGRIASMEVNHKVVEVAKKGQAVAMKIVGSTAEETQKMFGRHFDHEDELVSHITRRSIDVLKESFRDELSVEEWKLVVKLKKLFNIP